MGSNLWTLWHWGWTVCCTQGSAHPAEFSSEESFYCLQWTCRGSNIHTREYTADNYLPRTDYVSSSWIHFSTCSTAAAFCQSTIVIIKMWSFRHQTRWAVYTLTCFWMDLPCNITVATNGSDTCRTERGSGHPATPRYTPRHQHAQLKKLAQCASRKCEKCVSVVLIRAPAYRPRL